MPVGERGFCRNKVNVQGRYFTLVYGRPSALQIDPNLANNSAVETTLVVELADLAISKLDDPDPVTAGSGTIASQL